MNGEKRAICTAVATQGSNNNGLASPICHSAKSIIFESIFLH